MYKTNEKKGFTLIELLIVITIIGILAAALLPSILGAPARARDAARKAHLNSIIAAIETYNNDNQTYPSTGGCINDTSTGPGAALAPYFQGSKPPTDPQGANAKNNAPVSTTVCKGYYYCKTTVGTSTNYYITALMEVGGSGNTNSAWSNNLCVTDPSTITVGVTGATQFVIVK